MCSRLPVGARIAPNRSLQAAKIAHRPHNASRWRAALKLTDPLKFEVIAKPQTKKARHLWRAF
jgi:hypothetical protein